MTQTSLQHAGPIAPHPIGRAHRPRMGLGKLLALSGAGDATELARADALAERSEAPPRDVLRLHGIATEDRLLAAEAASWTTGIADLDARPPDPRLMREHDPAALLRAGCLPWRRVAGVTVYASARPERFARYVAGLPGDPGPCHMMIASEEDVSTAIERLARPALIHRAETLTAESESCRSMSPQRSAPVIGALLGVALLWGLTAPQSLLAIASLWAVITMIAVTGLRLAAACLRLRGRRGSAASDPVLARLPVVSMLVPLFHEEAIASGLVRRLRLVDYPRELLDICLVVEADDMLTRRTLEAVTLPPGMRVVAVPGGAVRTKPRALNYALPFARGSIVGVWDAEDAPAPGQIRQIVQRFAARGPEVACLQGQLDYYNSRHNWVARCFALEYGAWFRVFLPGIERMGLPVPLGGTTVFLRREAIEAVGGWDAHNVTEDADLGIRLARRGYRTEVVETVTMEEPNCRPIPWIRQRSRWLKGYALTWAVHMRRPRALWRDLGPRGFLGLQVLFLGTLSQFALAPLLYLFVAASFGMPHPLEPLLPAWALAGLSGVFVLATLSEWAITGFAASGPRHRHLIPSVLLLGPYYAMATVAVWKALAEIAFHPFYWDKTPHGAFGGADPGSDRLA